MEIEWSVIVDRLSHHRQRLQLSKDTVKTYIKQKYSSVFWKLTDAQIVELGKFMASCQSAEDFTCNIKQVDIN